MTYDPAADGFLGYQFAIDHARERLLRAGQATRIPPRNEREWLLWRMDWVPKADPEKPGKVERVRRLALASCRILDVPPEELFGDHRPARIARIRQAVAYVARRDWGYSFPVIALGLCRKDHTTIMYAVEAIRRRVGMVGPSSGFVQRIQLIARNLDLYEEAA